MTFLRALWHRFDDWINPIVIKELRQAVKSRMVVTILLLFLALQLLILGISLLSREARGGGDNIDWYAGNDIFKWQQGILALSLAVLVPAYASIRLMVEHSSHNVDLLFISTLRPGSIIWGKFVAALTLAVLIFSTCAPFMTFTYLLRGIDLPTIFTILAIDLLAMMFATMAALLITSVPGGLMLKVVIYILTFPGLLLTTSTLLIPGTVALAEIGVAAMNLEELWAAYLMLVLGVVGLTGLMYFCSVALISPPSSNRNLALRVYLSSLWLVLAVFIGWVTAKYEAQLGARPLTLWVLLTTALVGLLFLISICERDHWGPRITRAVPRAWWGRLAAWLFFTGAGGGVLTSGLLATAGFLLAGMLLETYPGMGFAEGTWIVLRGATIAALYLYCYGMSAVLIRTYLMAGQMKTGLTWLLVVLLVGIGSSVPAVISFVLSMDRARPVNDVQWWMVPNPFVAVYQMIPGPWRGANDDFATVAQWFLGIWALVVTGLALPWYAGMLRRFQPLRRAGAVPVSIVETAPAPRPSAPLPQVADVPFVTPADS